MNEGLFILRCHYEQHEESLTFNLEHFTAVDSQENFLIIERIQNLIGEMT